MLAFDGCVLSFYVVGVSVIFQCFSNFYFSYIQLEVAEARLRYDTKQQKSGILLTPRLNLFTP